MSYNGSHTNTYTQFFYVRNSEDRNIFLLSQVVIKKFPAIGNNILTEDKERNSQIYAFYSFGS